MTIGKEQERATFPTQVVGMCAASCHPGVIKTRALLHQKLPARFSTTERGWWNLKGIRIPKIKLKFKQIQRPNEGQPMIKTSNRMCHPVKFIPNLREKKHQSARESPSMGGMKTANAGE
jgi:hypothetical protein